MNLFLKLPIYDRVSLLECIPNHDTFCTLMTMPEFGFLNKNNKLQNRLYKSRLERYFSHYESFYEENTSWKEIYDRIVKLETDITNKTKNMFAFETVIYAKNGQLMELKILLSKGILPNVVTANNAAYYNQIKILYWMKENDLEMPDQSGMNRVAYNGHFELLKWMKENNLWFPDEYTANCAVCSGKIEILNWLKDNGEFLPNQIGANTAAVHGHINVLEWMKENSLPLPNQDGAERATSRDNFLVLKWMRKNCNNIIWSNLRPYTTNKRILTWLDKQ